MEAGRGGRSEPVWAAFPRVAAKGRVPGRQLEEEAELEACRGVKAV